MLKIISQTVMNQRIGHSSTFFIAQHTVSVRTLSQQRHPITLFHHHLAQYTLYRSYASIYEWETLIRCRTIQYYL